jgi:hypothetical protein
VFSGFRTRCRYLGNASELESIDKSDVGLDRIVAIKTELKAKNMETMVTLEVYGYILVW